MIQSAAATQTGRPWVDGMTIGEVLQRTIQRRGDADCRPQSCGAGKPDRILRELAESGLPVDRVYAGVGTNEVGIENCGESEANELVVQGVNDLSAILLQKGLPREQLKVHIEECAVHSPSAWSERFAGAMAFLFGSQRN